MNALFAEDPISVHLSVKENGLVFEPVNSLQTFIREILIHAWTRAEKMSNEAKCGQWIPKIKREDCPTHIGKNDEQLGDVIAEAVAESQFWCCHEHSEKIYKPLYDSKMHALSNKIIKNVMGARFDGAEMGKQTGVEGFVEMCTLIHNHRAYAWQERKKARRKLFKEISEKNEVSSNCINRIICNQLGHKQLAEIILIHGVPSVLQSQNEETLESLSRPTAEAQDIRGFILDFLEWWGHALHCLDGYSNSSEVNITVLRCSIFVPPQVTMMIADHTVMMMNYLWLQQWS